MNTHTLPRRLTRFGAAGLIAAAAGLGLSLSAAAPALAHDQLTGYELNTDPGDGHLKSLTLSFSDKVLDLGTEIRITDGDENEVADGAPQLEQRDVIQPVKSGLKAGAYNVAWRVVSSDGHPIEGIIAFEITADGEAISIPEGDGSQTGEAPSGLETPATEDGAAQDSDSTEAAAKPAASGGPGVGTVIAVGASVAVVIAGMIVASVVGTKRRRQAIEAAAEAGAGSGADSGSADQSSPASKNGTAQ